MPLTRTEFIEQIYQLLDYHYQDLYYHASELMMNEMDKLVFRVLWNSEKKDRYGEYYGVPAPRQTTHDSGSMPAEVVIFAGPLASYSYDETALSKKVRLVLIHEIGHHLGLSEGELRRRGIY